MHSAPFQNRTHTRTAISQRIEYRAKNRRGVLPPSTALVQRVGGGRGKGRRAEGGATGLDDGREGEDGTVRRHPITAL